MTLVGKSDVNKEGRPRGALFPRWRFSWTFVFHVSHGLLIFVFLEEVHPELSPVVGNSLHFLAMLQRNEESKN